MRWQVIRMKLEPWHWCKKLRRKLNQALDSWPLRLEGKIFFCSNWLTHTHCYYSGVNYYCIWRILVKDTVTLQLHVFQIIWQREQGQFMQGVLLDLCHMMCQVALHDIFMNGCIGGLTCQWVELTIACWTYIIILFSAQTFCNLAVDSSYSEAMPW